MTQPARQRPDYLRPVHDTETAHVQPEAGEVVADQATPSVEPEARVEPAAAPEPEPEARVEPAVAPEPEPVERSARRPRPDAEASSDPEVEPLAPLDVRLAQGLARLSRLLPEAYIKNPASFKQHVDYSLLGDWAADPSAARRYLHLGGTVLCLLVKFIGVSLMVLSDTPTRLVVSVTFLAVLVMAINSI